MEFTYDIASKQITDFSDRMTSFKKSKKKLTKNQKQTPFHRKYNGKSLMSFR